MGSVQAIELLLSLIQTATNAMATAGEVSQLIQKANAEKRDISTAELAAIVGEDDVARAALVNAILKATPPPATPAAAAS